MCFLVDAETSKTRDLQIPELQLQFGRDIEPALLEYSESYSESLEVRESIGTWRVSTYYTPLHGQRKYFNGSYAADFNINCSGDCFVTASGHRLTDADISTTVACPPSFSFGTELYIDTVGKVICYDRGGAIKGKRLDLWVGYGDEGFHRIGNGSGWHEVFIIK